MHMYGNTVWRMPYKKFTVNMLNTKKNMSPLLYMFEMHLMRPQFVKGQQWNFITDQLETETISRVCFLSCGNQGQRCCSGQSFCLWLCLLLCFSNSPIFPGWEITSMRKANLSTPSTPPGVVNSEGRLALQRHTKQHPGDCLQYTV